MNKRKFIAAFSILAILCGGYFVLKNNRTSEHNKSEDVSVAQSVNNKEKLVDKTKFKIKSDKETSVQKSSVVKQNMTSDSVKRVNLVGTEPSCGIPFSAIAEIASIPENIQICTNNVINKYNGILMLKKTKDKIVIIAENPDNIRHGIDFIEISVPSGHQTVTTLGYNGKIKDAENDIWEYNQNRLPIKHTKYNKDGDIEFTETWNYETSSPIKYEMKNSDGKTLSIRKETLSDNTDLRIEHLIYDTNGNTKINVSTTYEGENVKRFTYYNADNLNDSESIFSEFSDGIKTKEAVYDSNLKLKNVFEASYENGSRTKLTVFDSSNNQIEDIVTAHE